MHPDLLQPAPTSTTSAASLVLPLSTAHPLPCSSIFPTSLSHAYSLKWHCKLQYATQYSFWSALHANTHYNEVKVSSFWSTIHPGPLPRFVLDNLPLPSQGGLLVVQCIWGQDPLQATMHLSVYGAGCPEAHQALFAACGQCLKLISHLPGRRAAWLWL